MNWDQVVKKVAPHVVKIETPSGHGTGFLLLHNDSKTWVGIATAEHVVSYADDWQQPIKIYPPSGDPLFLKPENRVIYRDWKTDSAVILFFQRRFSTSRVVDNTSPNGPTHRHWR